MRAYGERNAQNSPLQGSAADLIKLAMIRIHAALRERRARGAGCCCRCTTSWCSRCRPAEIEAMSTLVKDHMEHVVELARAAGGGHRGGAQLAGREALGVMR